MNIEKEIVKFEQTYGLKINRDFLERKEVDAFVLNHVRKLFEHIDETASIKLTPSLYLPPKIVQAIATMPHASDDSMHLKITSHYIESKQPSIQRVRILCDIAKLTKVQKDRLVVTPKGKKFIQAAQGTQFVVLFMAYMKMNLGYFDGFEKASIVQALVAPLLQHMRDMKKSKKSMHEYTALFLNAYVHLDKQINQEITQDTFSQESAIDRFTHVMHLRVVLRFLEPMGLVYVESKPKVFEEESLFEKSTLLDALLVQQDYTY